MTTQLPEHFAPCAARLTDCGRGVVVDADRIADMPDGLALLDHLQTHHDDVLVLIHRGRKMGDLAFHVQLRCPDRVRLLFTDEGRLTRAEIAGRTQIETLVHWSDAHRVH